jgi:hypothetical protein
MKGQSFQKKITTLTIKIWSNFIVVGFMQLNPLPIFPNKPDYISK